MTMYHLAFNQESRHVNINASTDPLQLGFCDISKKEFLPNPKFLVSIALKNAIRTRRLEHQGRVPSKPYISGFQCIEKCI